MMTMYDEDITVFDRLEREYFEWLLDTVCGNRFSKEISYRKLLTKLYNTEFTYSIPKDRHRANDGINLRYRYSFLADCPEILNYLISPCNVLEMMIALAIRCEEDIMHDTAMGNRTGQWFWGMVISLGLGSMYDEQYDVDYVEQILDVFLNREYEPNGRGGLFTIRNCKKDLRDVEIWYQMCWYLDTFT